MSKDFDNNEKEMVYIVVKDEFDDEGDKMALISHVSKNDTCRLLILATLIIWMVKNESLNIWSIMMEVV